MGATVFVSGCSAGGNDNRTSGSPDRSEVSTVLKRLTGPERAPGALLEVSDADGRTVYTDGLADTASSVPMAAGGHFRIGSMTKTFAAVVALQLVAEHRMALDEPIETWLPDTVRANGNDGRAITVRQLLQHTSGIPDYLEGIDIRHVLTSPLQHYDSAELLRVALDRPRAFAPGTKRQYSNTNYVLVGMLIEKVTGRSFADEVHRRIIEPLHLAATDVPGDEPDIAGPHPHGYARLDDDRVDRTRFNPSISGSAGGMISSAADMNHFLDQVVNGRLLGATELREMMTTRPADDASGSGYGLGLDSAPLPCGGTYWGYDGGIPGFQTLSGATTDGRSATVMTNLYPNGGDAKAGENMRTALATALCRASAQPGRS